MITKFKLYESNDSIMNFIDDIENGNYDAVKFYIKKYKFVDDDSLYMSPLQVAIDYGQPIIAHLLIDNGADLNFQDNEGWTPLMWANMRKEYDLLVLMIKMGADLTIEETSSNDVVYMMSSETIRRIKSELPEAYQKYLKVKKAKEFNL